MRKEDPLKGKIRAVEAQILDKHHEGHPLLRRGELEAVSHRLKVYGNLVRDFFSPELREIATDSWLTELELWTRALEQGLRWTLEHCQPRKESSGDSWSQIDDEALSLLAWARSYVKLGNDHTTASRGHYIALCDEVLREIQFRFKSNNDLTMLTCQLASWPVHTNAMLKGMPEPERHRLFDSWLAKVDLSRLNNPESLPHFEHDSIGADFQGVMEWGRRSILPELGDHQDLAGFSLGQLRTFWAHLFVECQLVTRLEHHVDNVIGPDNDLGSVMYQASELELAAYFAQKYGLENHVVLSIIDCLTFDPKSPKSTSTNSPFVKTCCGTVSLLCQRVVALDPNIMVASALAKRSRKRVYEALVNEIEQHNVVAIAAAFRHAGFVVLAQESLASGQGDSICPDIIIYEPATQQVLISEYKHALPPIGAGEVDNRLRDLDEWTDQVRRYLRFAAENREAIMAKLGGGQISRVDGMLLFRWPLAIPGVLQEDITYSDWASLSVAVRKVEGLAIKDILRFYRFPRDAEQTMRKWEMGEERITVGEWTYRRPLVVSPRSRA